MNVLLLGNFIFPQGGLADTKRKMLFLEHFIEKGHYCNVIISAASSKPRLKKHEPKLGVFNKIQFYILGDNLKIKSLFFVFGYINYLVKGFKAITNCRIKGTDNILLGFDRITIDNFWFLIYAKVTGWDVFFDIVEDYSDIYNELFNNDILNRLKKIIHNISYLINMHIIFPKLVSGIIIISKELEEKYKKYKIPLCYIPIMEKINPIEMQEKEETDITRMFISGSLSKKDGIEYLLEAFHVIEKCNDCKLIITGNANNKYLKELIEEKQCSKNVVNLGYLEIQEYKQLLNNIDIFLMTRNNSKSSNSGFPFKVAEYLATGKPLITTNVSDINLFLINKIDAMVINPESSGEIVDAIKYLLEDKKRAKNIGFNGRLKCEEYFSAENNGEKLIKFVKDCGRK